MNNIGADINQRILGLAGEMAIRSDHKISVTMITSGARRITQQKKTVHFAIIPCFIQALQGGRFGLSPEAITVEHIEGFTPQQRQGASNSATSFKHLITFIRCFYLDAALRLGPSLNLVRQIMLVDQ